MHVPHCICPTGPGGCHPPNTGIGPRVNREEQPGLPQVLVQSLSGHTRLHTTVHVLCIHLHSGWHRPTGIYTARWIQMH